MSKKKKPICTNDELKEIENLDFVLLIQIISLKDMKNINFIDSHTFKEYLKKQIETDYEGGANNE